MNLSAPQVQGPFVVWEGALAPDEVDAIVAHGDALLHSKATLEGRSDAIDAVRVTDLAWIEHGPETQKLYERLSGIVLRLNADFYRFDLTGLENLQYTIYDGRQGGHYDWHIDFGHKNFKPRKISLSIQLSDPADYEGCALQFQIESQPVSAPRGRGTAIAFPSFFLHRVTPVTRGVRKSLVLWATGPEFR
jgi:PKHD-type hydroxylase